MASLDKEQADLEKALATSADEHAKLVAAKQAQELLLVEHLSHINIASDSRGGWIPGHSSHTSTKPVLQRDMTAMVLWIDTKLMGLSQLHNIQRLGGTIKYS